MSDIDKPRISEDCCEVWGEMAAHFGWFSFKQWPDLYRMAHVDVTPLFSGGKLRVNYCPSCGAERRNTVMDGRRLYPMLHESEATA